MRSERNLQSCEPWTAIQPCPAISYRFTVFIMLHLVGPMRPSFHRREIVSVKLIRRIERLNGALSEVQAAARRGYSRICSAIYFGMW